MTPIKYHIFKSAAIAAALTAAGCSQTTSDNSEPAAPMKGKPVEFTISDAASRSAYDPDDKFQLVWLDDDRVSIHSLHAEIGPYSASAESRAAGDRVAHYIVNTVSDGAHHSKLSASDPDRIMLWTSDDGDHTFQSIYPTQHLVELDENKVEMDYITSQICEVDRSESRNGKYVTTPDMSLAYMLARNTATPINAGHAVLHFDPLMTTFDLTVTAGKYEVGTGIIQPVTVTGVSVIMPQYLEGGRFEYDFSTPGDTKTGHGAEWHLTTPKDGIESIFVGIKDGANHHIDLFEGETLNLMAFTPPIPNTAGKDFYIKVHTTGNYQFIKKISVEQLPAMRERARIDITLPNIFPDGVEGIEAGDSKASNIWMKYLNEDMALNQISLPGVVIPAINDDAELIKTIKSYLAAGVRAFDFINYSVSTAGKLDISDNVASTFNQFVHENPSEIILLWTNYNGTSGKWEWRNLPVGWNNLSSITRSLKDIRDNGGIVAAQRNIRAAYTNKPFTNPGITAPDRYTIFYSSQIRNVLNFDSDWVCHDFSSSETKTAYESIFKDETRQSGATGIVMIEDIGVPYRDGVATWSNFLLQAVIDCNYKFNSHK